MPLPPSDDERLVIDVFKEKKGRYGIRRLKMHLKRKYHLETNLKKIVRIKKKFGLLTAIRRRNKFRALFKAGEEHSVAPNLVQRNFNPPKTDMIYSTDITELHYLAGRKAYLSAVKDLKSKEIVHYSLSERPTLNLAMDGLRDCLRTVPLKKRRNLIIHSDQGYHYTSYSFRSMLKDHGIKQSMSRKGNCLDNSPIESFFGHLKDEAEYGNCKNFMEVKKVIQDYMTYYNNDRPQWKLKQKTPAEAGVRT